MTVKSAKRKGTHNEHRSMAILEAAGYRCTRAGASLGMWDFIGYSAKGWVVCQVKTRDWPGALEMRALVDEEVPENTRKLVHRWRDRQRLPDVKEL